MPKLYFVFMCIPSLGSLTQHSRYFGRRAHECCRGEEAVRKCFRCVLQAFNDVPLSVSQNQEIEELTKICDELIAKLGTE